MLPRQLIIAVTREDIKHGRKRHPECCPIANSIYRRFKLEPGQCSVDCDEIRIGEVTIPTPYKVELWITRYDGGHRVKPTTFFLDAEVPTFK